MSSKEPYEFNPVEITSVKNKHIKDVLEVLWNSGIKEIHLRLAVGNYKNETLQFISNQLVISDNLLGHVDNAGSLVLNIGGNTGKLEFVGEGVDEAISFQCTVRGKPANITFPLYLTEVIVGEGIPYFTNPFIKIPTSHFVEEIFEEFAGDEKLSDENVVSVDFASKTRH